MAKKPPPPPSPPASSSEEEESSSDEEQPPATSKLEPQTPAKSKDDEDEEEESEDESEEESDDDGEEPGSDSKKPQPPAPAPAPAPTPAPSKPASESGSGSESESEDDSDSEAAKLVTPISSRPMADGPVLKASDSEKPNGKPLFQRIWTPDDEIAVLNAMVDYEPKHGQIKLNPNTIGDFLGFVRDSLSIGVSGTQLGDKIRRLKNKYSARAKNNGKGLKFPTAHDQAVYELAKKVWGKEEDDDDHEMAANGKANGVAANVGGKRGFPLLKEAVAEIEKKTGNSLVAEAMETIDLDKASMLEKKLKKQKMAEIKHNIRELDLLKETCKLIMEGAERAMD